MRALIWYKLSSYQVLSQRLRRPGGDSYSPQIKKTLEAMRFSHLAHLNCLAHVRQLLKAKGYATVMKMRGQSVGRIKMALIVSVGGDGTFLDCAKLNLGAPILAVNSDPINSVGHFCACDIKGVDRLLESHIKGKAQVLKLPALAISVNNKDLGVRALNDVLFSHVNPAAMSHYEINVAGKAERQRSSGVWISTAMGSTAGILSAGGTNISQRHDCFQFLSRELYGAQGQFQYKLKKNILSKDQFIKLTSYMPKARLFIDGAHNYTDVQFGDVIRIHWSGSGSKVIRDN